jgi:hypothetical protein
MEFIDLSKVLQFEVMNVLACRRQCRQYGFLQVLAGIVTLDIVIVSIGR